MSGKVSRRLVVGVIGAGAAAAPLVASGVLGRAVEPAGASDAPSVAAEDLEALVAPLVAGSRLARWTVAEVRPVEHGALTVLMVDASGQSFELEILARDPLPLGVRAIAETERFAIYMKNGGDGAHPTVEDHGLAAMALSQIVARNEPEVPAPSLLTHAERYARHPALREHARASRDA